MEELSPQERFNQLLAFLKDPQAHPHPIIGLDYSIRLVGRTHRTVMVHNCQREAIEIMETGIFWQGFLKGNRRTPIIPINRLEDFILQLAAAFHIAKLHCAKSPEFRFHTFDGKPRLFNELEAAWDDCLKAFAKVEKIILDHELISLSKLGYGKRRREYSDKINQLCKDYKSAEEIDQYLKNHKNPPPNIGDHLILLKAESLAEAHKREKQKLSFDLIKELILIFLKNVAGVSIYLIASHIFEFIRVRQGSSLKGVYLPDRDALRQEVKKQRSLIVTPPIQ
jgi:hypothetical protein